MKQTINFKKNSKKINLAVMFGGRSVEHEISVISALQLVKALDDRKFNLLPVYIAPNGKWYSGMELLHRANFKKISQVIKDLNQVTLLPEPRLPGLKVLKKSSSSGLNSYVAHEGAEYLPVDVFMPVFHGEFGEDGCVQGLFEMAEVNYTGFNVLASSLTMNKQLCKNVLENSGIKVLPSKLVQKFEYLKYSARIKQELISTPGLQEFPFFVKPNNRGSSIGIAKVDSEKELDAALLNVFKYDTQAIIEPFLADMFEMNIAVLSSDPPRASVLEIPHSDSGVLSYEDKYLRKGSKKTEESSGMATLARVINPTDLALEIKEEVTAIALKAFQIIGCKGNSRFDFMCNEQTGDIYLNEINSLPGSLAFYLWAESNPQLLYTDLIEEMVASAIRVGEGKASLERSIGFRAL